MIAVDTNLLVYAHRSDSLFHDAARGALEGLANSGTTWAIAWPCVHEFIAIVTHPRIHKQPTPLGDALETLAELAALPNLHLLAEGDGYLEVLARCAKAARVSGGSVHDTRIAALCLFHGVRELWSADRDFSRYADLVLHNPLRA